MTSRQFSEWLAYQRNEPIGQRREDLRTAVLAAVMANQFREKGSPVISPQDFLDDYFTYWPQEEEQEDVDLTPQEEEKVLLLFAQNIGLDPGDRV